MTKKELRFPPLGISTFPRFTSIHVSIFVNFLFILRRHFCLMQRCGSVRVGSGWFGSARQQLISFFHCLTFHELGGEEKRVGGWGINPEFSVVSRVFRSLSNNYFHCRRLTTRVIRDQ